MAKRIPRGKPRPLQPANLFADDSEQGNFSQTGAAEASRLPAAISADGDAARSDAAGTDNPGGDTSGGEVRNRKSPAPPRTEVSSASGQLGNVVQQASAGTGKTFALSNRFLRLVLGGAAPDSILASTFTRKGAGEILDRIVVRLGKAAGSEREAARLATELGLPLTRDEAILLLRQMVACLPTLQIGTLDSFFNRIARAFCFELGLPPDWTVVDPLRARVVHEQAVEAILGDEATPQLLRLMSKAEADRRVADLVSRTVDDLFLIYRDASPEAWDQFGAPSPVSAAEVDQVAQELEGLPKTPTRIADGALKLAAQLRSGAWEDAAGNGLLKKVREGATHYYRQAIPEPAREVASRADGLIRRQVSWLVATRTIATRDLLARFDEALQPLQLAAGELEFADLTFHLARNIQLQPKEIADRLGRRTEHLLLDEFQDTAPQQWAVLKPLAEHVTQPDTGRTFFCVGDRKQAIYGWRGGESRIFDAIFASFGQRVSEAPPLVESYRSCNAVLDLVNAVFGNFGPLASLDQDPATRSVLSDWGRVFKPHFAANPQLLGCAEVRQAMASEKVDHEANMLEATVAEVKRLHERYPGKEIAVLLRSNKPIARLAHQLQQAGIATSEEAGNPLTDAAAVEVVLSAVILADHPGDGPARFHLSHSPLGASFGLQPEFAHNQESNRQRAHVVAAGIRRQLLESGYGPTIRTWARVLGDVCTEREAQRLEQLVEIAYAYDSSWTLRPQRFADHVREQRVADRTGARVRLMTMHAAKGLGFEIVVAPMMKSKSGWKATNPPVVTGRRDPAGPIDAVSRFVRSDDRPLLPPRIQEIFEAYQGQQVNEELCLLYVTLTRAKQHLSVLLSPQASTEWNNESGLLLRAIGTGSPGDNHGLLRSWGDADWIAPESFSGPTSAGEPLSSPASQDREMQPGDLAGEPIRLACEERTGRGWEWQRPSKSRVAAVGGRIRASEPVGASGASPVVRSGLEVARDRVTRQDSGLSLGTAWHRLLQQVLWQDSPPTRELLLRSLGPLVADSDDRRALVDEFLIRLGRGDFALWLEERCVRDRVLERYYSSGRTLLEPMRLDVRRELPFVVELDGNWLEGKIDRLLLVSEGTQLIAAEVVDFKTGNVAAAAVAAEAARHDSQLKIYQRAVGQLFCLDPGSITTEVVFTAVISPGDGVFGCRGVSGPTSSAVE